MKKHFLLLYTFLVALTVLLPLTTFAAISCDESNGGKNGFVPCGRTLACPCELGHIAIIISNILNFLIDQIAIPLGTIAIIIGGVLLLISAGNPNLAGTGKKIVFSAIIGLLLALCAKVIINWILTAVGYTGPGI